VLKSLPRVMTRRNGCGTIAFMTGTNVQNSATGHFGRQMRKERLAHGWSLREFSARTGIDAPHLSRIEIGKRPPTERVALACDQVFPERRGYFLELYEEMRTWLPPALRSWGEYEDKAVRLSVWAPSVIHGLFQTERYAHAMIAALPVTAEVVAARLKARLERQCRVLYREDPPEACYIIDHPALYRMVGSPEIMAAQMGHLLDVAAMPNVTVQVMPAVAHPATSSELIIADNSAAYAEHLAAGGVYTEDEAVAPLERLFGGLRAECYRATESAAIIKKAEETWTGENRASAGPTDRA
jgi:transcriptional regulator with XRE-family HTH domain